MRPMSFKNFNKALDSGVPLSEVNTAANDFLQSEAGDNCPDVVDASFEKSAVVPTTLQPINPFHRYTGQRLPGSPLGLSNCHQESADTALVRAFLDAQPRHYNTVRCVYDGFERKVPIDVCEWHIENPESACLKSQCPLAIKRNMKIRIDSGEKNVKISDYGISSFNRNDEKKKAAEELFNKNKPAKMKIVTRKKSKDDSDEIASGSATMSKGKDTINSKLIPMFAVKDDAQ